MDSRDARDLLPAWALDAVDDVERAAVERAIRRDPALAHEARAFKETTTVLAEGGAVAPPATVREAVFAAIDDVPQVAATRSEQGSTAPRSEQGATAPRTSRTMAARSRMRWLAVAAALVVGAAVPSALAFQQAQRADRAEQQVVTIAEALGQPDAQLVSADVEGGGHAVAVVAAGAAVFAANGLPELTDRDYQLWVIDGTGPVSAGVMRPQDGEVTTQVGDFTTGSSLAVTVEPLGGSTAPSTPPIVLLAAGA